MEPMTQSQIKADMELKAVNKEALQRKQGTRNPSLDA